MRKKDNKKCQELLPHPVTLFVFFLYSTNDKYFTLTDLHKHVLSSLEGLTDSCDRSVFRINQHSSSNGVVIIVVTMIFCTRERAQIIPPLFNHLSAERLRGSSIQLPHRLPYTVYIVLAYSSRKIKRCIRGAIFVV